MKMDSTKMAKVQELEKKASELMEQIRNESDIKKKRKLIAQRDSVQRKYTALKNNRKIKKSLYKYALLYSMLRLMPTRKGLQFSL